MSKQSGQRQLIKDLREHIRNAAPWALAFAPCGSMTDEQRQCLEEDLEARFKMWAKTWVLPWIDTIEQCWLGPDLQQGNKEEEAKDGQR